MPSGKFTQFHLLLVLWFSEEVHTLSRMHKWIIYEALLGSAENPLV